MKASTCNSYRPYSHREDVRQALGGELWRYLDVALTSQTGLNLRNDVAHGLITPAQGTKSDLRGAHPPVAEYSGSTARHS